MRIIINKQTEEKDNTEHKKLIFIQSFYFQNSKILSAQIELGYCPHLPANKNFVRPLSLKAEDNRQFWLSL